jgi:hypothetical protein
LQLEREKNQAKIQMEAMKDGWAFSIYKTY